MGIHHLNRPPSQPTLHLYNLQVARQVSRLPSLRCVHLVNRLVNRQLNLLVILPVRLLGNQPVYLQVNLVDSHLFIHQGSLLLHHLDSHQFLQQLSPVDSHLRNLVLLLLHNPLPCLLLSLQLNHPRFRLGSQVDSQVDSLHLTPLVLPVIPYGSQELQESVLIPFLERHGCLLMMLHWPEENLLTVLL